MIGAVISRNGTSSFDYLPDGVASKKETFQDKEIVFWWTPSSRVSFASSSNQEAEEVLVVVVGAGIDLMPTEITNAEIILRCFLKEGLTEVEKIVGESVVLIYESSKDKLHLISDNDKVHRVYWTHNDRQTVATVRLSDLLRFVSDLKLHASAVKEYFYFGYVPSPKTMHDGVHVTEPSVTVTLSGGAEVSKAERNTSITDKKIHIEDAEKQTLDYVIKAINKRILPDEPIHALLSAGYDSTLLAIGLRQRTSKALAHVMGFEDRQDNENEAAAKILNHLGIEHRDIYISVQQMADVFPRWIRSLGQPWAHPNGLSTKVAYDKITQESDGEVVVNGIGGDGLFSDMGLEYKSRRQRHLVANLFGVKVLSQFGSRLFKNSEMGEKLAKLSDLSKLTLEDSLVYFNFWKGEFGSKIFDEGFDIRQTRPGVILTNSLVSAEERYKNYSSSWAYDSSANRMFDGAFEVGLVATSPLEDADFRAFVSSLEPSIKYPRGQNRILQKNIVYKYVPSDLFLNRKWAIETPLATFLSSESGRNLMNKYLGTDTTHFGQILEKDEIEKIWSEFSAGSFQHAMRLWSVLVFEAWFQERQV
tara:strand:+ start:773 stop:2539 length:1767 start_codon:yes stop_codon:yes gene_type:complete